MRSRILIGAVALFALTLALPQSGAADNPTVLICHITNPNAGTGHVLRVNLFDVLLPNPNENAVAVHTAHGDFLLADQTVKPGSPC